MEGGINPQQLADMSMSTMMASSTEAQRQMSTASPGEWEQYWLKKHEASCPFITEVQIWGGRDCG